MPRATKPSACLRAALTLSPARRSGRCAAHRPDRWILVQGKLTRRSGRPSAIPGRPPGSPSAAGPPRPSPTQRDQRWHPTVDSLLPGLATRALMAPRRRSVGIVAPPPRYGPTARTTPVPSPPAGSRQAPAAGRCAARPARTGSWHGRVAAHSAHPRQGRRSPGCRPRSRPSGPRRRSPVVPRTVAPGPAVAQSGPGSASLIGFGLHPQCQRADAGDANRSVARLCLMTHRGGDLGHRRFALHCGVLQDGEK
jgi:hypothetical protein